MISSFECTQSNGLNLAKQKGQQTNFIDGSTWRPGSGQCAGDKAEATHSRSSRTLEANGDDGRRVGAETAPGSVGGVYRWNNRGGTGVTHRWWGRHGAGQQRGHGEWAVAWGAVWRRHWRGAGMAAHARDRRCGRESESEE